jgi:hypothetical protein
MRKNMKIKLSKAGVVDEFTKFVYPTLPHKDATAVRTAWNEFVDSLQKSGNITENQAATWDQPAFVKKGIAPRR